MGGYGSGRWRSRPRKLTVEECLTLDIDQLRRERLIMPGVHREGVITFHSAQTGEADAAIGYEVSILDRQGAWLRLQYCISQVKVDYRIALTISVPGRRWWFICPLSIEGRACGRRVGRLYLQPAGDLFGCRQCCDLTYRSCQRGRANFKERFLLKAGPG